jgi:hypothetical protein
MGDLGFELLDTLLLLLSLDLLFLLFSLVRCLSIPFAGLVGDYFLLLIGDLGKSLIKPVGNPMTDMRLFSVSSSSELDTSIVS